MQENLDILPQGAADAYEEYLGGIKASMDQMIEEAQDIASQLDQHDENNFTQNIQEVIRALAGNIAGISNAVLDITKALLKELEEKNEIIGSSAQDGYIEQIRRAADGLADIEVYRDCELLKGGSSFSNEDKEELQKNLRDWINEYQEQIQIVKEEAEELNSENAQNELSGVYLEIAELLNSSLTEVSDLIEEAGVHLNKIEENYSNRKTKMENQAKEEFESALTDIKSEMQDVFEVFTGIDF